MTTVVEAMLDTYPADLGGVDPDKLASCIETCVACAQACTACADACLAEPMVGRLTRCIRTNADCAVVCAATAAVLSRHTGFDVEVTLAVLNACATACRACGDECGRHADMHEHCRLCAEACRRCEQACAELITSLKTMFPA
ncbi:four-helix bundle copper-binding protein [Streptosporangium saharense]|uniref:four-helix bundle copper-binding protein n=1 Tax=Streptosporangium saharense TaxID=1706840 RepID=UPI0033242A1E